MVMPLIFLGLPYLVEVSMPMLKRQFRVREKGEILQVEDSEEISKIQQDRDALLLPPSTGPISLNLLIVFFPPSQPGKQVLQE